MIQRPCPSVALNRPRSLSGRFAFVDVLGTGRLVLRDATIRRTMRGLDRAARRGTLASWCKYARDARALPGRRRRSADRLTGFSDPDVFKALSDPTRLRLLACLAKCGRACSVGEVAECCAVDLSVVSHHLSALADAGVVESSKEGRSVSYRVRFAGNGWHVPLPRRCPGRVRPGGVQGGVLWAALLLTCAPPRRSGCSSYAPATPAGARWLKVSLAPCSDATLTRQEQTPAPVAWTPAPLPRWPKLASTSAGAIPRASTNFPASPSTSP